MGEKREMMRERRERCVDLSNNTYWSYLKSLHFALEIQGVISLDFTSTHPNEPKGISNNALEYNQTKPDEKGICYILVSNPHKFYQNATQFTI